MAVYFTSDLHLGHEKILSIRTQFQTIDEHDMFLIEKWNKKVKKNDEVYILGDLSFRSKYQASHYLSRLQGRKHLIIGNHDNHWMRKCDSAVFFESIDYFKTIKLEKKQITLCHYPMLEWPGSRYVETGTSFLVHGHIHCSTDTEVYRHIKMYQPHAFNACVDINDFQPVSFEELMANNDRWYDRSRG